MRVGEIRLADLCRVLTAHGGSLTDLRIITCKIIRGHDSDFDDSTAASAGDTWGTGHDEDDDEEVGNSWGTPHRSNNSQTSKRSAGKFEKSLSACLNLTHLSIEPGCIPMDRAPTQLFQTLTKLESLEWNKKNTGNLAPEVWLSLLGLGPALLENERKMKSAYRVSFSCFALMRFTSLERELMLGRYYSAIPSRTRAQRYGLDTIGIATRELSKCSRTGGCSSARWWSSGGCPARHWGCEPCRPSAL